MKKVILFSLMAFVAGRILAQNIKSIAVGSKAPKTEVKMKDVTGKTVSIKDAMKQNGALVMFSCNTCPYVVKNEDRIKEIAAYALKNNIGVIILNSNEAKRNDEDGFKAMQVYANQQGYNWYYVEDVKSEIADAFGATRTPETFLINTNGSIVYKGAIDDNPSEADNVKRSHLKIAIDETLSGKTVTVKESKSVGCGIKRS